jgi:hypothetical protein
MKLVGKTAWIARGATTAAVATVLRREGARVETEIAEAVLHLASDDAFTIQGEEVVLTTLALAS